MYIHVCTLHSALSQQLLEREVESESGAVRQRLETTEELLGEKERELTEARERISSLSDELVISQGKVHTHSPSLSLPPSP